MLCTHVDVNAVFVTLRVQSQNVTMPITAASDLPLNLAILATTG